MNDDVPTGWLASLRRLRSQPAHQMSLPRSWSTNERDGIGVVVGVTCIPGLDPFEYLKTSCNRVSDLTEQMVAAASTMSYVGATTPLARARW